MIKPPPTFRVKAHKTVEEQTYTCPDCGETVPATLNKMTNAWRRGMCECGYEKRRKEAETFRIKAIDDQFNGIIKKIGIPTRFQKARFQRPQFEADSPCYYALHASNACDTYPLEVIQSYAYDMVEVMSTEQVDRPPITGTLNLILQSCVRGNGKTHLASAIINEHLTAARRIAIENSDYSPILVNRLTSWRFVNAVDLTDININHMDRFRSFMTCGGLVIDDICQEYVKKGNDDAATWRQQLYYDIINQRYNAGLPTIITTNADGPQFATTIGESAFSRLQESGYLVELHGPSHRTTGPHTMKRINGKKRSE